MWEVLKSPAHTAGAARVCGSKQRGLKRATRSPLHTHCSLCTHIVIYQSSHSTLCRNEGAPQPPVSSTLPQALFSVPAYLWETMSSFQNVKRSLVTNGSCCARIFTEVVILCSKGFSTSEPSIWMSVTRSFSVIESVTKVREPRPHWGEHWGSLREKACLQKQGRRERVDGNR